MFMGAEGTLGVITAACLRLFPKIENKVTAFASLSNLDATIQLLETLKSFSGELLSSYELIPKIGLDIALRYGDELVSPIPDPQEWNVIIEYSDTKNNDNANDSLENALGHAIQKGVVFNAAIASSLSQAQNIWKIRKAIVEHQPRLGGEIKHDCSVPVSSVPEFIRSTKQKLIDYLPDVRPVTYGHIGDGNIHFNVCPPSNYNPDTFKQNTEEIREIVYGNANSFGGSFAA